MSRRHQPGVDLAIRVLLRLIDCGGCRAAGVLGAELDIPRSTLFRISRILAETGLLTVSTRGVLALGPLGVQLAQRRDALLREGDDERGGARTRPLAHAPGTGDNLFRHPQSIQTADCMRFRRAPRYKIGFANAAIDSPWRTALVHSVEYGAVKHRRWISALSVRHAAHSAAQQSADIQALLDAGVDGLIVSAVSTTLTAPVLRDAERRGVPTILVDRGMPDEIPHVSFVTCDDHTIGARTALWLAEQLRGAGSIILLPGLAAAEPAQRRLVGANRVFDGFPNIEVLATEWTGWQSAEGRRLMRICLDRFSDRIDGVWCDSGLQAVGSLKAFLTDRRWSGPIPPHTGGDLNLAYKLAIRHNVPLAAVDYPPAMGLRAVGVLLDVLRGRTVPRRIDVATETVVTRPHATASIQPDLWADEHVRWDLPDDLILASGLGFSYDPRSFRIRYRGNRYNRSAAVQPEGARHGS